MPIAHRRHKRKHFKSKLVDLSNVPYKYLNTLMLTDSDATQIKNSLIHANLELERLTTNIIHTQRRLESMRTRRDELIDQKSRYHIAIAPHKRLPPELMREIFVFCLPDVTTLPPRTAEAPLLLTRVCSSWRALALDTQELWTSFEVQLCGKGARNHVAIHALNIWLSRCPDRSLEFKINSAPRAPFPLPSIPYPILPVDLITPHTHRIKNLDLQNISGEQMNSLITRPLGCFPLLEELNIVLRNSWMVRMEPWEATAFRDSTKLYSVSVSGFDGTFNPAALGLPWNQLRILRLDTLIADPIGCHGMLRLCTSLEEASVRVMRIEHATARHLAQLPETILPTLTSLSIRFESSASHGKFIESFILPSLRVLNTRFEWCNDALASDDLKTECFINLIEKSRCSLQRLVIGRNSLDLDVGALLEMAEDLKELELADHVRVPMDVWERMAKGELGRKLEKFGISIALVDPLFTMLEARMSNHLDGSMNMCQAMEYQRSGLKEMKLGCPRLNYQQRWRKECLEKSGLKISLSHYGFFDR